MIIENKIKCKKCGDVIVSENRHDFKWCKCKACAVDGGFTYLRRIGDQDDWEELSTIKPFDWEKSVERLHDILFYEANEYGTVTVEVKDLRRVLNALEDYSLASVRYLWMLKNGKTFKG